MTDLSSPSGSILIVADDVEMAALLRDTLAGEGFQTSVEFTGRGAIAATTRQLFDLVILDTEMPDLGGFALLRELRQRLPEVRLMFLTAFGGTLMAGAARKRGADHYLDKPIHLADLITTVRAVLAVARDLS